MGVAKIREPKEKRLWLGTFENAVDGALSYDKVARAMHGSRSCLNFSDDCLVTTASSICLTATPAFIDSATTSNCSRASVATDINVRSNSLHAAVIEAVEEESDGISKCFWDDGQEYSMNENVFFGGS
jgi:hypothetical protein